MRSAFERRFIAASYAVVIGFSFALLAVWDHQRTCIWNHAYCSAPRPKSLFALYPDPGAFDAIHAIYKVGVYGGLAVVFIALIVRRIRGATHAGRRVLAPLLLAAAFAATRAVSEAILGFVPHSHAASEGFSSWSSAGSLGFTFHRVPDDAPDKPLQYMGLERCAGTRVERRLREGRLLAANAASLRRRGRQDGRPA